MDGLRGKQVLLLTNTKCEEIKPDSVTVGNGEGQRTIRPVDTVVLAVGYKSNDDLFKSLQGKVSEIFKVGDASQIKGIRDAMNDGYKAGLSV